MALRTANDIKQQLSALGNLGLTLSEENANTFEYLYQSGVRVFLVFDGRVRAVPFSFPMEEESITKYKTVTGHTEDDLKCDLLYHWLDGFRELSSFNALRERIQDPATCGSMATTIAVNLYIKNHNSNAQEIKELLSGSKWRWKKTEAGEYIQQTLYKMYNSTYTLFGASNSNLISTMLLTGVNPLTTYIQRRQQQYLQDHARMEQQRRAQEEARAYELKGYTTRATEFFKFTKGKDARYSTFLGIELELENHSRAEFQSLNTIKDHAIFKRDGSLQDGVEICTAPATMDVHKEQFKNFFSAMETNKSKLQAKSSCGMHVHIDRSKLSTLHVANLCLLLNKEENNAAISSIAGRSSNSYCKTVNHTYEDFTAGRADDRYRRVNLTPSKTVELRLFASTTKYEDFCTRLEFTQAVVDYTRPGATNISCKDIPKWENFKSYVMKHRSFYPTLVKVM